MRLLPAQSVFGLIRGSGELDLSQFDNTMSPLSYNVIQRTPLRVKRLTGEDSSDVSVFKLRFTSLSFVIGDSRPQRLRL